MMGGFIGFLFIYILGVIHCPHGAAVIWEILITQ